MKEHEEKERKKLIQGKGHGEKELTGRRIIVRYATGSCPARFTSTSLTRVVDTEPLPLHWRQKAIV